MLLLTLAHLTICPLLAATPAPAVVPDTGLKTMTDTAQVELTAEALTKLTTFVVGYTKHPKTVLDSAKQYRIMMPLTGTYLGAQASAINSADMVAFAAHNAAVAQEFTQAKLTPEEYLKLRRTLSVAWINYSVAQSSKNNGRDTTTLAWRNVEFVRAHQADVQTLASAGMLPGLATGGQQGGSDALDP